MFFSFLPASFRQEESTDYLHYYAPVARNLLSGEGLTLQDLPALRYPPGYPILLAVLFSVFSKAGISDATSSLICMIVFGTGSVVLVYSSARMLWGEKKSWIAALLWMTYPFLLWLTQQPNVEIPFLFFFWGGLFFWISALFQAKKTTLKLILCGMFIGVSMLIRPIALGVGVILALLIVVIGKFSGWKRIVLAACILLGNVLAIFPWELWAYGQIHQVIPLSTGGIPSMLDGLTFAISDKGYRQAVAVPKGTIPIMQEVFDQRDALSSTTSVIRFVVTLGLQHPGEVALLYLTKAARSLYATDSGRLEGWILLVQIPYFLLSILAMIRGWKMGGRYRMITALVMVLFCYFWVMTISVLSILRYMVPAIGLLFLMWPALKIDALHQKKPLNA